MKKTAEICCGSYYDAKQSFLAGARRIEFNSALSIGGLTPVPSTLEMVKRDFAMEVAAMVRPRGAGFCYNDEDFTEMVESCKALIKSGADGLVFGCLTDKGEIDLKKTEKLVEICKAGGKKAVFHRAFDCCKNPYLACKQLISLGIDRILTSGQQESVEEGIPLLKELFEKYGDRIEFVAAGHITSKNVQKILEDTGLSQAHSSCKTYFKDSTTIGENVGYSMLPPPYEECYFGVSKEEAERFVKATEN